MNIQNAKQEIINTLHAYLQKDEYDQYIYPTVRQRPIILMGPPGVGKTAIMEQIAKETGVALLSYTMTHHTRQSAVGLPRIIERSYNNYSFPVTEYTMSEIVAEIYQTMEKTGIHEGILFLDEINCVSETLAPTMLQLLQNKTFGNHKIPEGWIIVAAGNPPEYNKSVRDFDVVTLDRVRQIDVEADLDTFLSYAVNKGIHNAIISYLTLYPEHFYRVTRVENQLSFATARGWEDLSQMLSSCENLGVSVEKDLISEYIRNEEICREFSSYYYLYMKNGTDFGVVDILNGSIEESEYGQKIALARKGDFTEKYTIINHVLAGLIRACREYHFMDDQTVRLHELLKLMIETSEQPDAFIKTQRTALETKKQFSLMDEEERRKSELVQQKMEQLVRRYKEQHIYDVEMQYDYIRGDFEVIVDNRKKKVKDVQRMFQRAFQYTHDAFGDGHELTLLLATITGSQDTMEFIVQHGCDSYLKLCNRLMFRKNEESILHMCKEYLAEYKEIGE